MLLDHVRPKRWEHVVIMHLELWPIDPGTHTEPRYHHLVYSSLVF